MNAEELRMLDQKLDRIIELLEDIKARPLIVQMTNPPNPLQPYGEARELMHPDLGPNVTYTTESINEANLKGIKHSLEEWTRINDNRD